MLLFVKSKKKLAIKILKVSLRLEAMCIIVFLLLTRDLIDMQTQSVI